jgi:hypothetical protein
MRPKVSIQLPKPLIPAKGRPPYDFSRAATDIRQPAAYTKNSVILRLLRKERLRPRIVPDTRIRPAGTNGRGRAPGKRNIRETTA